jgi:hypothetical protein
VESNDTCQLSTDFTQKYHQMVKSDNIIAQKLLLDLRDGVIHLSNPEEMELFSILIKN